MCVGVSDSEGLGDDIVMAGRIVPMVWLCSSIVGIPGVGSGW